MATKENPMITEVAKWMQHTGLDIIIAILIGVIVYYVGKKLISRVTRSLIKSARHREWHKKDIEKRQKTLVQLFATIWRLIVIFSVMYAILRAIFGDTISNTFAPLFASAGIIGIAVGIGAQSLIRDFLSGIFIISENQYRVGDVIDIEGASGTVERIGARSTVLRDAEGNVHYFPNGMVQHVINKTMGFSMARFTLLVQPTTDIDDVSDIIDEIGKQLSEEAAWKDKILDPPAFVSIGEITGNSTEVIISGKTQPSDQWAVISEMRRRLHETFEQKGIKLAINPLLPQSPRGNKKR
jgi:small-conductance mechanosensitive channel